MNANMIKKHFFCKMKNGLKGHERSLFKKYC